MEQQTAVELFANEVCKKLLIVGLEIEFNQILEQAKQLEKKQREQDFIEGYKKRAEISNLVFDEESELYAKSLFSEKFKTE